MRNRNRSCGLGLTATGLITGGMAMAQAPDDVALDEIVVTGTRLQTASQTPTPVVSLGEVAIEKKAPVQILDAIYDMPSIRLSSGTGQNQRTQSGAQFAVVDLRGLNPIRTLVLVDGRRQVQGTNTGLFDTNRIPTNLVSKIDVVTGGASAAYGSDAVAGVVNFVINDKLEGMRVSAQYGASERGDNEQYVLSMGLGAKFADDRLRVVFGGDYADSKGVGNLYSRAWGRREPGLVSNGAVGSANRPAGTPASTWTNNVELATVTNGGIIIGATTNTIPPIATNGGVLRNTAFDPNGQPYAFNGGRSYGALMTGSNANVSNNGQFPLVQPIERGTAMGRLTLEVAPGFEVFGDLSYTWVHTQGQTGLTQFPSISIPLSNPYIPAATRTAMVNAGLSAITLGYLGDSLNPRGTGPAYVSNNTSNTIQGYVGTRGTIFDDWKWDVAIGKGQALVDSRWLGSPYVPNLLAATYVINDANGNPVCGPIASNPNLSAIQRTQVLPGCVPFNIFGLNSPSAAARAYVSRPTRRREFFRQETASVNLAGKPFSTWAGPVAFAVGGEARRESIDIRGEGLDASAFNFAGTTTYGGKQNVVEGYLETGVPLLSNVPFVKALDLNAAVRETRYSISGNVTTWKLGATYDMSDAVRWRVTRSRDIRAPNLNELYQVGPRVTTNSVINPFNTQTGQLFSATSGNLDLKPEEADTFTTGIVFKPSFLPGFDLAVDYYSIKINGVVAAVSAVDTLTRCKAGQQFYCSAITFDNSNFGIGSVALKQYNLNVLKTAGLDVELGYRLPRDLLVPGQIGIRALGTHVTTLATTDTLGNKVERAGTGQGVPDWTWIVNFDYSLGGFSAQLQARYFSALLADPTLQGPDDPTYNPNSSTSISQNRWPSATYLNLQADYKFMLGARFNVQLFASINNLLDKQPPEFAPLAFSTPNAGFQAYDLIGRMYKGGVRVNF